MTTLSSRGQAMLANQKRHRIEMACRISFDQNVVTVKAIAAKIMPALYR
jgi:hypothetical protein